MKRTFYSQSVWVLLACLLALSAAGCSQPAAPIAPTAAPAQPAAAPAQPTAAPVELETVTVSISSGLDHMPVVAGLEKGIFEKYGIDLKIKVMSTGVEIVAAQKSGDTQFAPVGVPAFSIAASEQLDLIVAAMSTGRADSKWYDSDIAIIANQGTGVEKGKPETLKGKTVGVPLNTLNHYYLSNLLKKHDLSLADVTLVNIGPADLAAALDGKNVDVIVIWEPFATSATKKVAGAFEVVRGGGYANRQVFYATSPDIYNNDPELVERYLTAFADASQWVRQEANWDEAAQIATRWFTALDVETARAIIPNLGYDIRVSKTTCEAGADTVKFLRDAGALDKDLDPCASVDTTILNRVIEKHPELFEDLPEIPADQRF